MTRGGGGNPACPERGEELLCERGTAGEDDPAPKPFTDATLLAAMTGIARYVCRIPRSARPCGRPTVWAPRRPGRDHRSAVQAPLPGAPGQEHQGHPDRASPGPGAAHDRHDTGHDGTVGAESGSDRRTSRQLPAVHGAAHRAAQRPDRGARQDPGASFSALPKAAPGDSKQRFARRKRTGSTAARPARARARVLMPKKSPWKSTGRGRPGARRPEAGARRDHIKIRRGPVAPLCMDGAPPPCGRSLPDNGCGSPPGGPA